MKYALLFPGQASQQVGMGADFRRVCSAAEAVFKAADRETDRQLTAVITDGPLERLTETRFAQPAVVATSLATLVAFRERLSGTATPPPTFCAGHSVGEIAALVAASVADISTALHLVTARSWLMAETCDQVDGTMAAVLGTDEECVTELCRDAREATGQILDVANLNAPGQIVVSGHRLAIEWLQREAPSRGARRVLLLNVGGPFHSAFMRPAAQGFAAKIEEAELRPPGVPIVLNQTARATCDLAEIKAELSAQITAPVRWADSLRTMFEAGCTLFLEIGPGEVLSGLVRRTLPRARALSVNDVRTLEATAVVLEELVS